jgi:hypothetical protein
MVTQREEIEPATTHHRPTVGAILRRLVFSVLLAIPMAGLAFLVSGQSTVPNALRYIISPGWIWAIRLVNFQTCGGFIGCMLTLGDQLGQMAQMILLVNLIVYSIVIFGIVTLVSSKKQS